MENCLNKKKNMENCLFINTTYFQIKYSCFQGGNLKILFAADFGYVNVKKKEHLFQNRQI